MEESCDGVIVSAIGVDVVAAEATKELKRVLQRTKKRKRENLEKRIGIWKP